MFFLLGGIVYLFWPEVLLYMYIISLYAIKYQYRYLQYHHLFEYYAETIASGHAHPFTQDHTLIPPSQPAAT